MTAPLSIADKEYASLVAQYGANQSMQDMRLKQFGGPTVPPKSEEDLAYDYFAANGGSVLNSRSDNESKFWAGNNSLSDDKNIAGGVIDTSPPINPFTEGPANLAFGFWSSDPAQTKPADGGTVASWRNSTGGNYVNGPAGQPTYRTNDPKMGYKSSLVFDGVDDALAMVATLAQPYYVVVIGYIMTPPSATTVTVGNVNNNRVLGWSYAGIRYFTFSGLTLMCAYPQPPADESTHLFYVKSNGATSTIGTDNNSGSDGDAGSLGLTNIVLGAGGTPAAPSSWSNCGLHFVGAYTADPRLDPKWTNLLQLARSCGAPVVINPLIEGPANLAHGFWAGDPLWVTGKPADNAVVTQWRNGGSVGGDVVQATPAKQPFYRSANSELNGKPGVRFDGTSMYMSLDITDIPLPYYVVAVGYKGALTNARRIVGGGGPSTSNGMGISSGGYFTAAWGGVTSSNTPSSIGVHLMASKAHAIASSTYLFVNENGDTLGGSVSTDPFTGIVIGAGSQQATPQYFWDGPIAFVGIYTSDPRLDPKWPNIVKFAREHGAPV